MSLDPIPDWYTPIYRKGVGSGDHEGAVPLIADGDFTLAESAVIARYLIEKFRGPMFLTADEKARVEVFINQV